MNDVSASSQGSYIPRNAIDHMNPFFYKSHHAHTHHAHSHHRHSANYSYQQPYPDTHHNSVADQEQEFLQTPVPRRLSVQIETTKPSAPSPANSTLSTASTAVSYNTPPATPPLDQSIPKPIEDAVAWCTARARIPTPDGSEYFLHIYENSQDKKEHLAFVFGDAIRSKSLDKVQWNETEMDRAKRGAYTGRLRNTVSEEQQQDMAILSLSAESVIPSSGTISPASPPLVRVHSECFTGEIGHSARCDCGEQLDEAIRLMKAEGSGVVVYLRQEGRGIGLAEKLKAYNLQDLGYDTVMANLMLNHGADERTYEVAQAILEDLGMNDIRLLTNNPDKIEQVEKDSQIKVVERVPMMPKSWEAIEQGMEAEFEVKEGAVENKIVRGKELDKYLKVKVERMRHLIPIPTSMNA
ncbi:GTP cyclohydrolase II [Mortierella polycephala]|uniref:GTP cyclohydrolase II n=1 Tax=Mortierella polycephala TaxID=41804 RepID=A0A9P6QAL1_9FUNG|nr:GTP cyclohydrolase II [Mortierella polycephala]